MEHEKGEVIRLCGVFLKRTVPISERFLQIFVLVGDDFSNPDFWDHLCRLLERFCLLFQENFTENPRIYEKQFPAVSVVHNDGFFITLEF